MAERAQPCPRGDGPRADSRFGPEFESSPSMARVLWIIVAVLILFWLAGAILGFVGDIIHFVLVVAIALAIFAFVKRRV